MLNEKGFRLIAGKSRKSSPNETANMIKAKALFKSQSDAGANMI